MKHIHLVFDFFYRNKLKSFFAMIILTAALIIFSTGLSEVRYYSALLGYIDNPVFEDGLYLQTNTNSETAKGIVETAEADPSTLGVAGFVEVGCLYSDNLDPASLKYTNDFTAEVFKPNISEGYWINECEEGEYPNVVVSGEIFKDVSVGDNITVCGREIKEGGQTLHVVGRVASPYYEIEFRCNYGSLSRDDDHNMDDNLGDCFISLDTSIYIADTPKNRSFLDSDYLDEQYQNMLLAFKPDSTEQERKVLLDKLDELTYHDDSDGFYTPAFLYYDGMIEATHASINEEINNTIPFDIFVAVVSLVSVVVVSVLCVKEKQKRDYIAFLCGCSKKKTIIYTFIANSLLSIIPMLLTFIYIYFVPILMGQRIILLSTVYYDGYSYLYAFLYALVILLVSFAVSSFSIMKKSPIELYKNNMKG